MSGYPKGKTWLGALKSRVKHFLESSATQSVADAPVEFQKLAAELHARCGAAQFGVSCDDLARILAEIAKKYSGSVDSSRAREFCLSLKLEELVLARGCAGAK